MPLPLQRFAQALLDGTPRWIQGGHVEDQAPRRCVAGDVAQKEPMEPRPAKIQLESQEVAVNKTGRYGKPQEKPLENHVVIIL